jgi:hypothetical protein
VGTIDNKRGQICQSFVQNDSCIGFIKYGSDLFRETFLFYSLKHKRSNSFTDIDFPWKNRENRIDIFLVVLERLILLFLLLLVVTPFLFEVISENYIANCPILDESIG